MTRIDGNQSIQYQPALREARRHNRLCGEMKISFLEILNPDERSRNIKSVP